MLLSRNDFRESVFKRDGDRCVVCCDNAQDAHHIIERRLFEDGGYYIDNGVSLCGNCHIKAEQTLLTPEFLRARANIKKIILPEHLYPDYEYDKWGNIVYPNGRRFKGELFFDESVQKVLQSGGVLKDFSDYIKYPRTYHLPCSKGRTDDDKSFKDYSNFEDKKIIITEKMDGENTTAYWDGYIHARSIDGNSHPSRNWVKNYLSGKLFELPKGWRICGENLYAKHSIHYDNLKSYFLLFSIWNERNECLSWKETTEWAKLLDLEMVGKLYEGGWKEYIINELAQYVDNKKDTIEGFVIRNSDNFSYANFRKNVGKFVRQNHVQTNKHWIKQSIVKNNLCQS